MPSPGNLVMAEALGSDFTISANAADSDAAVGPMLADSFGLGADDPERAEIEKDLEGETAGDLIAAFSQSAANAAVIPDVQSDLNAISDPEERRQTHLQLTTALTKETRRLERCPAQPHGCGLQPF